ncbi:hypothetical protein FW774_17215 [Pedobacter sp. BS3]|uniref:hypothetical protein n=1 Tax=Pedobacter sp. BS3 TaxID=2567937 RepID=UPI0011F02D6B|nr:hypothetical protein [Pedobacter sp. BS3]TZF81796.1 hypothetical protein FW774_17215 [Pedobacter sp. BS3]
MKKLFLLAAIAAATACKKDNEPTPEPSPAQTVTYAVECTYCLVYVEDNYWNHTSETERGKNQHFVVSGKWHYSFENKGLDSVKMDISVSALQYAQPVKASITTSDNRRAEFNNYLGFELTGLYPYDTTLALNLK